METSGGTRTRGILVSQFRATDNNSYNLDDAMKRNKYVNDP